MTAAVDRAYAEIRRRILEGELPPGSRLREVQLAEETNVSRTPVREALRRLSAEGLVVVMQRRGAVVSQWSATDMNEIFELRTHLEGLGARLAARKIDTETVDVLEDLALRMDALRASGGGNALAEIAELNSRFHQMVARSSGNERLVALLGQVVESPLIMRTFHHYTAEQLARSTAHHLELVAALRAGEPEWAESVMKTHILAARVVVMPQDRTAEDRSSPLEREPGSGGDAQPVSNPHHP